MKRFVRKGEQGITILAPLIKKVGAEDNETLMELGEDGRPTKQLFGFRTVTVFAIEQTDGEPIPTVEHPTILTGMDDTWYAQLCAVCPFPVDEFEGDTDGSNGFYTFATKQISIRCDLPNVHKAKTLIHEWAHGLLHGPDKDDQLSRSSRELEAESTAFIVANALGLDTSDYSFSYIAGWKGEDTLKRLQASGGRIQEAAETILGALELKPLLKEAV